MRLNVRVVDPGSEVRSGFAALSQKLDLVLANQETMMTEFDNLSAAVNGAANEMALVDTELKSLIAAGSGATPAQLQALADKLTASTAALTAAAAVSPPPPPPAPTGT